MNVRDVGAVQGAVCTPPDLYERDETAWLELSAELVTQGMKY